MTHPNVTTAGICFYDVLFPSPEEYGLKPCLEKKPTMKTNTNALTTSIIRYLNASGYKVWRNNTSGVFDPVRKVFRRNPALLKGVPDIIGYRKPDKSHFFPIPIFVEVKTGRDKLSPHQQIFAEDAIKHRCIYMCVRTWDEFEKRFKIMEETLKEIS